MDFRTTILPHRDRLFRLALSITLDRADAEDVVQDAMLKAWERREEWPQIKNIEAWLTQICKNLALDHQKKRSRIVPLITEEHPQHTILSPLPNSEGTTAESSTVEARDSLSLLQRLIRELPSPMDDLVFLRDIEGLSYREIATQLDLTEDQVRVYLHRTRTRLRERYAAIQGFGL